MGGDVGVVSEPGHGSTFFVVLRDSESPGVR
jgi:signal transduction histidine kinase